MMDLLKFCFFFFQAEDGIRDIGVTGVQTCALPIYCANFVSQVLRAGGMPEEGSDWDRVESWFCRTNSTENLSNISITWRAARYFRRYFGNEDGFGENKAAMYIETTAKKVLYNFKEIYAFLDIGDVIQYGSTYSKIPYHTQVIVDKKFNPVIGRYDLFMAQ